MQELGERIAALAPAKRAILEARLAARQPASSGVGLAKRTGGEPAPLSFSQERLWFLASLEPQSNAYNLGRAYRLKGIPDIPSLERALWEIQRRHEILRTVIGYQNGEGVQLVAAQNASSLVTVDLSQSATSEEDAVRLAREEISHPFDLRAGPVIRAKLFRLSADDHVLALAFHHVAFDGWSAAVFNRELSLFYRGFREGHPAALGELPIQYSDYAVWQRQQLATDRIGAHLSYWRKQLADLPLLELPADRPRPAVQGYSGDRVPFKLTSDLSDKLRVFNSREGATPFMTLLSAYQVLLCRYSGQVDILVGTPVANRRHAELENMIGFFVNTVAIRADLSARPTFRELVARCRETAFDAYQYQDLPFEKLVQELNPKRDMSRHPIFQVSFTLQNAPFEPLALAGLDVAAQPVPFTSTRFDLELSLWADQDLWSGFFCFSKDLFDAFTIERLAGHYQILLEALLTEPDRSIFDLPLLSEAERKQVLIEWNNSRAPYQDEACLDELFEAQARQTPDAMAVAAGGRQLSYRDLSEQSSDLSSRLQRHGVRRGALVGICMERSIDMLVGLMGILKSGGAYVPLDPTYPKERLDHILEDARPDVVLTEHALEERFGGLSNVVAFDGIGGREDSLAKPDDFPRNSGDLAYVLYTSGSTGKPKGVEITHRSLVNFLASMVRIPGIGKGDTLLAVTTLAFDIAGLELLLPLIVGARVVIATNDEARDGTRLLALMESCGVTVMQATPATWRMLLAVGWQGSPRLKILCGGEAWPRELAADLLERCGSLWNMYGPTETTIWSAVSKVEAGKPVVVGPPIANTTFYVLDGNRQPVPVGVPGELHIGGDGVARGYFKRPELTAEKFIADPFAWHEGARLYRTGDLARFRHDGTIEFLGRMDNQVKVRGFRIELGEIESVLGQIDGIRQCVVAAREDTVGEKRLVAYLVPEPNEPGPPSPAMLRDRLRQALPDYMVPTAFVVLDELPLTPNGKIDRRALPEPQHISSFPARAELTQTEQIVANVWADALKTSDLDVHQSFFDLGGYSLLAIQIVFTLRRILQIDIAVAALFANPTIAALSRHLDAFIARDRKTARPPIERVSRDQPLPLSFAQESLWRNECVAPNPDNIYVLFLDVEGDLNIPCLERSLQTLVRRHEIFRTTFHLEGSGPVQRIAVDLPTAVDVIDLTGSPNAEEEITRLVFREKTNRISLSDGPLMRCSVLRLALDRHRLLLRLHHMLYDTWSLSILLRELDLLYQSFCSDEPSPLPDLPVQIADFAVWQRQYLEPTSTTFQAQLAYWKGKLSGKLPVVRLPCERPCELQTASMEDVLVDVDLPGDLSANLKALTRREGATLFMTFLAALKALINLSTGQNDIMLGAYMAKRSAPESDRMMGYFSDLVPFRTVISSDLNFLEVLSRVRQTVLEAQAHEDMPFDMLRAELEKSGQTPPNLRAIFMVDGASERSLGDLRISQIPVVARDKMPWGFQMRVREGAVFSIRAKFDARAHDPRLVKRMISMYAKLLDVIARAPTAPLCEAEAALRRI